MFVRPVLYGYLSFPTRCADRLTCHERASDTITHFWSTLLNKVRRDNGPSVERPVSSTGCSSPRKSAIVLVGGLSKTLVIFHA